MNIPTARQVAQAALQIAVGYSVAGVHEEGGNNRGDQVEFYQSLTGNHAGDPWCASFVSTCLVKAFCRLSGLPEDRLRLLQYVGMASHLVPVNGYCPALWAIAKGRGQTRPADFAPQSGDLMLFDWKAQGEPHHVAMVRGSSQIDCLVSTVEGNTSDGQGGSQADGDGVFCRVRPRTHCFGFIHLP